jgi:drug/metabolite transporter (DMT)-like permease
MVAVLSGNLLLHEAVGWREIGALALVCVAIVLVLRPVRAEGTT